jgi:hypothetical protein
MIIALALLYLALVLAVAVGLVAASRWMCRKGDEERAAEQAEEAAEFAAWLRLEFVPQSQYQERGDR